MAAGDSSCSSLAPSRLDNYDGATSLGRAFEVDAPVCESCGGPAKLISAITDPVVIRVAKKLSTTASATCFADNLDYGKVRRGRGTRG